ncbi:hypothetical protein HQ50_00705 [Porphyromonas sp. COT-052 OH4946]|nr:hypothetical protein HQ50_00705 [Porphyromonas sp. COT-052 OH4946]
MNMNKNLILSVCFCLSGMAAFAQNNQQDSILRALEERVAAQEEVTRENKKIKISGYVQGYFQHGEKQASLNVGSPNENTDEAFNRIGIRRGHLKFAYGDKWGGVVLQMDVTEKGVGLKDAYMDLKSPLGDASSIRAGLFDRPFGHEIGYSSSRRESPERSMIFRTLFPNERDLGAKVVLQTGKTSPWHFLKLEAGLFAGNGIKPEIDNRKDFIGRISAGNTIGNAIEWGIGASLYSGGVYQGSTKVFRMNGSDFELDDKEGNKGAFATRRYYGVDAQFSYYSSTTGMTRLRGEFIGGTQPGTDASSKSPNSSSLPTADTYIRPVSGGYILLAQDIATLPFTAIAKYDWYDPNTKVSKDEIGKGYTGKADIAYQTLGLGLIWRATSSIKLTAYHEWVNNEKTASLSSYTKDRQDNRLYLCVQYKF